MLHKFRYLPVISASVLSSGHLKCYSPIYSSNRSISVATSCKPKKAAQGGACGEDACVVLQHDTQIVMAVADGVGGWRKSGVDPSLFSNALVKCLADVSENVTESDPLTLMKGAFWRLVDKFVKKEWRPFGSATFCVAVIHNENAKGIKVDVANLGDSGLMVIRDQDIIFRTDVQQAAFNTPYQLTLRPEGIASDTSAKAQSASVQLEKGDIVVMGTDGLFDNVFPADIINVLSKEKTAANMADSLVATARMHSLRTDYESPFAVEALKSGKFYVGGKPDDITVIVALID